MSARNSLEAKRARRYERTTKKEAREAAARAQMEEFVARQFEVAKRNYTARLDNMTDAELREEIDRQRARGVAVPPKSSLRTRAKMMSALITAVTTPTKKES